MRACSSSKLHVAGSNARESPWRPECRYRGAAGGFPGSLKPFASPGGWYSDVNHYKIRVGRRGPARELDGVASLTHHLEARAFEQTGHPLTEQQLVFCQVDAHTRWFRLRAPSTLA